ncbi:MAG: XdhC family protein [Ruminococcus sp.]
MNYRDFYLRLTERLKIESSVEVTTILSGKDKGKKFFKKRGEQEEAFCETFLGRIHTVLCGGGHVSLAVAGILKTLDYELTVIDDREEFASAKRFPMADHVLCLDFEKEFSKVSFPPCTYYVILTRGHEHDYTCLSDILKRSYGYLGMIGSKSKVRHQKERLRRDGFTENQIETVHAPIGLPIGGQTPAEIAVSIAAEIIQVKNRTPRDVLEDEVVKGLMLQEPGVVTTVIDKQGSSPRGKGSRMVVTASGKSFGTIGGGAVEYQVVKDAAELWKKESAFCIRQYDLSHSEAAALGMMCGGRVKVMFERYQ